MFAVFALVATFSAAHAAGVHIALAPLAQSVAPGSTFLLELSSTEAGDTFNGYEVVVSYDPTALTLLPTNPTSLQEGSYMVGACGTRFHRFEAAGDSINFTDILLCNQVVLPGPGQLYKLNFRASLNPGNTFVSIRSVEFYHGGTYVTPVVSAGARIGIGVPLDVGDGGGAAQSRLSCAPNPFRGGTVLRIETPAPESENLRVVDTQGRAVRHLQSGTFRAGARSVTWDGRDDAGRRVAAGLYFVRLSGADFTTQTRVTLLQ